MNVIGIHPGLSTNAPDSYTQWTGGSGIIDALGMMLGGRAADPATPGSGDPGSTTTEGAKTSGVDPQNKNGKMLLMAAAVVLAVLLLK